MITLLLLGKEVTQVVFDLVLKHSEFSVVLARLLVLENESVHIVVYTVLVNIYNDDVVGVAGRGKLRYVF